MRCPCPKVYTKVVRQYILVIDRYGNFHLTDTDMLIIANADIIQYPSNRYRCEENEFTDTDTDLKNCKIPITILDTFN